MSRWIEETFHPHWRVRLEASKVLHEVKTQHQHLVIFANETWGTVLMLDGVRHHLVIDELVAGGELTHAVEHQHDAPGRILEDDEMLVLGLHLVQHL